MNRRTTVTLSTIAIIFIIAIMPFAHCDDACLIDGLPEHCNIDASVKAFPSAEGRGVYDRGFRQYGFSFAGSAGLGAV